MFFCILIFFQMNIPLHSFFSSILQLFIFSILQFDNFFLFNLNNLFIFNFLSNPFLFLISPSHEHNFVLLFLFLFLFLILFCPLGFLTQAIIIFDKPKNGCKAYNLRSSLNSLKVPISVFTLVIFIDRLLVESIGSIVD